MKPTADPWADHTRHTLMRYDDALLRQVAHRLCKPRNQWPVDELLDRIVAGLGNAALLDRRLKELPVACRQLLAIIGRSRLPRWPVGSLVEMLVALGHSDGLAPLVTLLESGLLLPELFPVGSDPETHKATARNRFKNIEGWLSRSEPMPIVVATPAITGRVLDEPLILGLERQVGHVPHGPVHEADGLEWPLRLAVLWQQTLGSPLRRTQQGDYFKRDFERLKGDPLISAPPVDGLAALPDPGFFSAALASATGLLQDTGAELQTAAWPDAWTGALPALLLDLSTALLQIRPWNPADGHSPAASSNPYPSAYMLALLSLAALDADQWTTPDAVEQLVAARHPYWIGKAAPAIGIVTFLLGVAYSLRLLQVSKSSEGAWLIRLSATGRWLLGLADHPPAPPAFKQTLLVQPNLEILVYRQGLTPELIAGLSRIANWKTLGAACTLQLEPQSVYRALEMGSTFVEVVQLLEGHGMKAIPTAVRDSLKTWSSKRERLSVYSAGAIFEFVTPADMNEAIARGLPAVRLTDRLAIVARESDIDYKHFRLTGTRDYTLPPERCVDVEADGVTLGVDLARSDLLLETEIERFAEPVVDGQALRNTNKRWYRVTPGSLLSARQQGMTLPLLQTWFAQRTGFPIPAAAQLLMAGPGAAPVEVRRQLVLHVSDEHLADGLQQWPATRDLIVARLGPRALAVADKNVATLLERLKEVGVAVRLEE
jgi:hypothetical protein